MPAGCIEEARRLREMGKMTGCNREDAARIRGGGGEVQGGCRNDQGGGRAVQDVRSRGWAVKGETWLLTFGTTESSVFWASDRH